jgi:DUF971 family protein
MTRVAASNAHHSYNALAEMIAREGKSMDVRPGLRPVVIRRDGDDRLYVEWSDGRRGAVTWDALRAHCPCATCRDERGKPPDPFRVLSPKEMEAGPPRPTAMAPVGYYAYKITWTDGHDAGIYTLENLRELCEPV